MGFRGFQDAWVMCKPALTNLYREGIISFCIMRLNKSSLFNACFEEQGYTLCIFPLVVSNSECPELGLILTSDIKPQP
jgi:hypothetical protein